MALLFFSGSGNEFSNITHVQARLNGLGISCLIQKRPISLSKEGWYLSHPVSLEPTSGLVRDVRNVGKQHGIDCNFLSSSHAAFTPQLLMSDVDSTLIAQEGIDELARVMGKYAEVSQITRRAMEGEISFSEALRLRVRWLEGLTRMQLDAVIAHMSFRIGAPDLIRAAIKQGIPVVCASGGFLDIIDPMFSSLGISQVCANRLEWTGGRCSGHVTPPIIDGKEKERFFLKMCRTYAVDPREAVVLGDGANDEDMMRRGGLAIGITPKATLEPHCHAVFSRSPLSAIAVLFGWCV